MGEKYEVAVALTPAEAGIYLAVEPPVRDPQLRAALNQLADKPDWEPKDIENSTEFVYPGGSILERYGKFGRMAGILDLAEYTIANAGHEVDVHRKYVLLEDSRGVFASLRADETAD